MNKNNGIFRELTRDDIFGGKPFAHFGWEGEDAYAFETISDAYFECAKMLLDKMQSKSQSPSVVDGLIYPLFFNYRHSIEIYLKALFFRYGEQTVEARREFLGLGHDLGQLWAKLRPSLNKGKKHVGSSVDLDTLESYIREINKFDSKSMVMRYPIGKDLGTNKKEYRLDFNCLGDRMNEISQLLRQLDKDISNQMTTEATSDELREFLGVFDKYRSEIDDFLSILKLEEQDNKKPKKVTISAIMEKIQNNELSRSSRFLRECEADLLILLDVLFYGGHAQVNWAKDPDQGRKEFVSWCKNNMNSDGLSFGQRPEEGQVNIWDKSSSVLLLCISKAVEILTLGHA